MQHTPGPYTVHRALHSADGAYDYAIGAIVDGKSECIAEGYGRVTQTHFAPAEANANLFAAAPDLLRSCKALECFASGFEDCELQEGMAELLADARAAIAKAEGRDGGA